MPEKNANYCYSYLSKKVCRKETKTTLQFGDIAFLKQLDELYSMYMPTASDESVIVDVARVAHVNCLYGTPVYFLAQNFVGKRFSLTRNPFWSPLACIG